MLAALNIRALTMGLAAAGLSATLIGLLIGGGLALLDVESGPDIGLLAGVLGGMLIGGWVTGRVSLHSHRFHGSLAGLLLSGILIFLSSAGGAPTSIPSMLLLALVGILMGGLGGWMGGRRRARSPVK